MGSPQLQAVLENVSRLTPQERDELMIRLQEMRNEASHERPRRAWKDIHGSAPYPLLGEDAQDWVTRTRRESREKRERDTGGQS